MARIGFWQLLLDDKMSYWEAQRINDAQDAADIAASAASDAQYSVASMGNRMAAMSREIIMLRTALTVLTSTLKDTKVVDDKLLDARLAAAMEEAFPPPPPAQAQLPSNQTPANRMYVCLKCRQSVPARSTIMTADGPMCEKCP
jgi:hypothetical protein